MTGPPVSNHFSEVQREHSKLRHDLEVVQRYGEAHPEEWTEVLFENEPSVRIIVLVASAEPERHAEALKKIVAYPDQLDVRSTVHARSELEITMDEIRNRAEWPEAFLSLGIVRGRINVQLMADQESLASTLAANYGNALELRVGALPFPSIQDGDRNSRRVGPEIPLIASSELNATIEGNLVVSSGGTTGGSLRFHNLGSETIVLNTNGCVTARVLDPSTGEVIGGFVGAQTLPLVQFSIAPGASAAVPVMIGTASYRSRLGYTVPPGEWEIDALITLEGQGQRRIAPLRIVITPPSSTH